MWYYFLSYFFSDIQPAPLSRASQNAKIKSNGVQLLLLYMWPSYPDANFSLWLYSSITLKYCQPDSVSGMPLSVTTTKVPFDIWFWWSFQTVAYLVTIPNHVSWLLSFRIPSIPLPVENWVQHFPYSLALLRSLFITELYKHLKESPTLYFSMLY